MAAISEDSDILIAGGGIVGMSLAYGLAREGRRVTVLDEDDLSFRASRGNFALVWVQGKGVGMPCYARWTMRSAALWRSFASDLEAETGIAIAFEQRGGFSLYLQRQKLEAHMRALTGLMDKLGPEALAVELMDRKALERMLPAIGPDVVGGTYCRLDGHVNVLRLFGALHEACRRRGVSYRPGASVKAITSKDGSFLLSTTAGPFEAERVVLAAGLGNARLAPMVGLAANVSPQRGQIIVTEKLERFLDYPLSTLRQTDEGGVMIGASKEDAGFDIGTSVKVLNSLAADAVRMFPLLARAKVVRSWGALRVMTADGFPIYDASTQAPGAFLVTCHSGVTLAAAHALDLAPCLANHVLPLRFQPFSPRRFANVPETV